MQDTEEAIDTVSELESTRVGDLDLSKETALLAERLMNLELDHRESSSLAELENSLRILEADVDIDKLPMADTGNVTRLDLDRKKMELRRKEIQLEEREDRLKNCEEKIDRLQKKMSDRFREMELSIVERKHRLLERTRQFEERSNVQGRDIGMMERKNAIGNVICDKSTQGQEPYERKSLLQRDHRTLENGYEMSAHRSKGDELYAKISFTPFSGKEPVPKHESSFEEFKLEFETVRHIYSDQVLKRALIKSLKDQARKTMLHLGVHATIDDIMRSLEENFGDIASQDSILSRFLTAEQTGDESIVEWSLRVEEMLLQICRKSKMEETERKERLKNRFWRGLKSTELKQATRACFDSSMSYEDLRNKVRAEEFEINLQKERSSTKFKSGKLNQASVEACPLQTESMLTKLMKQMEELDKKVEELKEKQESQLADNQERKYQRGGFRGARGSRGSRGAGYRGFDMSQQKERTEQMEDQQIQDETLNA